MPCEPADGYDYFNDHAIRFLKDFATFHSQVSVIVTGATEKSSCCLPS